MIITETLSTHRAGAHPGAIATLIAALATALATPPGAAGAGGGDPFADTVVAYEQGDGGNPDYDDPFTTLGPPERFTGEGVFPSVVSPFSPPFGVDEIVSIGRGGVLVVRFDEPVTDDDDNPFGIDLLVFGNSGFLDESWPDGIVGGLFSDGGRIEVSADGSTWTAVAGLEADGLFPTAGYLDAGPYDSEPGKVETDFTRPVDPDLVLEDFLGLDTPGVLTLYRGAGGGAGIDLAALGLSAISFVRITNAVDAEANIEIDGFSDVAPRRTGDVTGDEVVDVADLIAVLAAWGACPDPPLVCPADLDESGTVAIGDLLVVLSNWTP